MNWIFSLYLLIDVDSRLIFVKFGGVFLLVVENCRGMDLAATLDCGQAFRWKATLQGWHGIVENRSVTVWTVDDRLYIDGADEEDRDFWVNYFALDLDYPALLDRFRRGNQKLAACVQSNPGIRVLRQPFFETLCTFIISQNNNIPRIKSIVERLCRELGQPLADGSFGFPRAETLAALEPEDLAFLRAGWRAEYLIDAARKVTDGEVCEEALRRMPLAKAREQLMTIRGVGPKVADCVLLFSLSFWKAFPMDVWMKKAMQQLFPRGIPVCCRTYAGIAQQYIFDYARKYLSAQKSAQKMQTKVKPHN